MSIDRLRIGDNALRYFALTALLLAAVCKTSAQAGTIAVDVDFSADRRLINPQIYAANFADDSQLTNPGFTVQRHGGNSTSRYDWQVDVHNNADDYFYQNILDGDGSNLPDNSTVNELLATALNRSVGHSTCVAGAFAIVPVLTNLMRNAANAGMGFDQGRRRCRGVRCAEASSSGNQ